MIAYNLSAIEIKHFTHKMSGFVSDMLGCLGPTVKHWRPVLSTSKDMFRDERQKFAGQLDEAGGVCSKWLAQRLNRSSLKIF